MKTIQQGYVEEALQQWESERDQVFALVSAIQHLLRQDDMGVSPEYNALQLATVAANMLGDSTTLTAHKALCDVGGV